MHIPDGYLDPIWCIATYAIAVAYFAVASRAARGGHGGRDTISLVTVLAAGIFAAQMLNWPLPGGTSLHFVGGALAGMLLGPFYGSITMALVLIVQCLLFHDGGITTLGANILNMAIIDVLVGYAVFKAVVARWGVSGRTMFIAGLIGGWLGIALAGVACGIEIGLSPQFPYGIAITVPVMGLWHTALGVIEGVITGLVISYIATRHPDMICLARG